MTRDMEARPYRPDELRVVEYINKISWRIIGAGNDPIGFLLAAHAMAIRDMLAAGRLLDWCLPRLPMAYRPTLQRMRADPMEFDHTPIVQSETRHD
mgnify:FL=1